MGLLQQGIRMTMMLLHHCWVVHSGPPLQLQVLGVQEEHLVDQLSRWPAEQGLWDVYLIVGRIHENASFRPGILGVGLRSVQNGAGGLVSCMSSTLHSQV